MALYHILILLAVAVILVAMTRYLRLPQVLAFLITGILVGPHGLGWIPDREETRYLAEFGLVFLMFTLGLEFSLSQLFAMKRMVLGLGGAQVVISALIFGILAWLLGVPAEAALVLGGVLALSSTAIVMKLLVEQLEQHSRHGRAVLAILLMQDLIVVPWLVVIPMLAGESEHSLWLTLGWALIKSVLVLVAIIIAGRVWLRPMFHEVALARSREFFMLTVLLIVLTCAWLTELAGLSLALGAFLAGLMIGETEYRHQVESDILPFRDVLLGLFFITVGMLLNLQAVQALWLWVGIGLLLMLSIKIVLISVLGRLFGLEQGVALRTGLVLAGGGEFGFALLIQADRIAGLQGPVLQGTLAILVLSMLLTPLLIRYNGPLVKRLVPRYRERHTDNLSAIRAAAGNPHQHVILCGYGRSGQNLAVMLKQEGLSSLGLDLDPVRVRRARDAGENVIYADATRADVLEAVGLSTARALAVSFVDIPAALHILRVAREQRPDMPVLVRTMDDHHLEEIKAAGATEVVPESLEGSLMMGSHLLMLLGVPVSRVLRQVQDARRDRYRMLRGFFHGVAGEDETEESYRERLHTVNLPPGAYAVNKCLADMKLEQLDVVVTAVRRGGIGGPQPEADTRLLGGDVLVLYGRSESLSAAEKVLLEG